MKYFITILLLLCFSAAKSQFYPPSIKQPYFVEYGFIKTDSGFIPARMTMAHRDSIYAPQLGMLIYQTDNTPGYYYRNLSAWVQFGATTTYTGTSPIVVTGTVISLDTTTGQNTTGYYDARYPNYWAKTNSTVRLAISTDSLVLGATNATNEFDIRKSTAFLLNANSKNVTFAKTGTAAQAANRNLVAITVQQSDLGGQIIAPTMATTNNLFGLGSTTTETVDSSQLNSQQTHSRKFFTSSGTGIKLVLSSIESLKNTAATLPVSVSSHLIPAIDSSEGVTQSDITHTWNVDVPLADYFTTTTLGNRGRARGKIDFYAGSLSYYDPTNSTFSLGYKVGLFIARQTQARVDTSYALYQAYSGDTSKFEGLLMLGTTPPGASTDSPLVKKTNGEIAVTAPVDLTFQTLTDGGTITWNTNNGKRPNAQVTLAGTRTLSVTNMNEGETVQLFVTQDGTGSRDLIFTAGTFFLNGIATGTTLDLTNTAGATDIISIMKRGSVLYVTFGYFHS